MSPMTKGRGVVSEATRGGELDMSRGRRRVPEQQKEDFVRAFIDALRDILHAEQRPTG
jgi:hypothetical protein